MKKVICLAMVLALCLAIGAPVMATENEFVPSIEYKDGPEIVKGEQDGKDVTGCLIVSTIRQAEEKVTDITQYDRDLLLDVYDMLMSGEMTLPIEGKYVIRDLLDVSYKFNDCREQKETHGDKPTELKQEGITLTVTFNLGVDAKDEIIVMVYEQNVVARSGVQARNAGQWVPAKNVKNNGDGTLTVEFEDICPVAFVLKHEDSSVTGDPMRGKLVILAGVMLLSVAGIVTLVVINSKKKKN